MQKRLFYLDNLKVMLTILVILHHIAIAFGGEGAFQISSKTQGSALFSLGLTGFLAVNQSYFMALFFSISSFFSYKSLEKKGSKAFIKNKFKRLFLPAFIYYLFLSPLLAMIVNVFHKGLSINEVKISFEIGALWFVVALFVFDLIYALVSEKMNVVFKTKQLLYAFPLVVLLTFVVRIFMPVGSFIPVLAFQPAHFMEYIFAYLLGLSFAKYGTLDMFTNFKTSKMFYFVALVLAIMGFVVFRIVSTVGDITYAFGGLNIYSLLYSLFDILMYLSMSVGLIGLFQKRFNNKNSLMNYLGDNAFGAYVMHSFAIVLSVMLFNSFNVDHLTSFLLVIVTSIPLSFVLGKISKPILG